MQHNLVQIAEDFFLDYFNNYLTVRAIADAYHISEDLALALINYGRFIHLNKRPNS